jgi:hypothetical protein
MNDAVEMIEPLLAYALEHLRGPDANVAREDVRRALTAGIRYLEIGRPPAYAPYNPAAVVRTALPDLADDSHAFDVDPVHDGAGDASQVVECLRVLVRGAVLAKESILVTEVLERDGVPCIALSFDGPGRFPQEIAIEGPLQVSFEEIEARWTAATRGGRIDKTPNGLMLRLAGTRIIPESSADLDPVRKAIEEAREACEGFPISLEGAACAVQRAMNLLCPEEQAMQPGDLNILIADVVNKTAHRLAKASIVPETLLAGAMPPIRMRRPCLRAFFRNLVKYAETVLPAGGALIILTDYDRARRTAEITVSLEGKERADGDRYLAASLRRAIADVHQGSIAFSRGERGLTIQALLSDPVGRALDEWIRGFEAFSDRSQRVLRLLKSGGESPPEDLLLAGVLEEELERWLLPALSEPPAINLAHELPAENRGLPGSSEDRLKKALDQIKRGKPRKEITKPPYAAEILYACRADDRRRKALNADTLDVASIERLCALLLQAPLPHVECLRIIARARTGPGR